MAIAPRPRSSPRGAPGCRPRAPAAAPRSDVLGTCASPLLDVHAKPNDNEPASPCFARALVQFTNLAVIRAASCNEALRPRPRVEAYLRCSCQGTCSPSRQRLGCLDRAHPACRLARLEIREESPGVADVPMAAVPVEPCMRATVEAARTRERVPQHRDVTHREEMHLVIDAIGSLAPRQEVECVKVDPPRVDRLLPKKIVPGDDDKIVVGVTVSCE